jgi:hypothetical protein
MSYFALALDPRPNRPFRRNIPFLIAYFLWVIVGIYDI